MTGAKIRTSFLQFFKRQGHSVMPPSPLVPHGDPSMLFTSAGMVQFKPYFLGLKTDLNRAAGCQKCFRTTDIDRVGATARHLTFFEMLGNFSFGDYFKKETIAWGWEFLTREMDMDPKRLYVSVYGGGGAPRDEEAFEIWNNVLPSNLRAGRIVRLGDDSNLWTMGPTGPCGPCSEIYWDRGAQYDHPGCFGVGCDCDRYIEIWNFVFTQFDRQTDGTLKPLPRKNIDTGLGLERLASALQGTPSPFETDLFLPIMQSCSEILNRSPGDSRDSLAAFRVIADHARACVFLISEGITPSNEGRGYVLRRLIRRASRYARMLGWKDAFLFRQVSPVISIFQATYPEIAGNRPQIEDTIRSEEERFLETLETGERMMKDILTAHPRQIPGEEAFKLYETYGFPIELTREIALKRGRAVDEKGFDEAKNKARKTAKSGWKGSGQKETFSFQQAENSLPESEFAGYEQAELKTQISGLLDTGGKITDFLLPDSQGYAVLYQTPFYPESGGQAGDSGGIFSTTGAKLADVLDTQRPLKKIIIHKIIVRKEMRKGADILARVSPARHSTACNHTATHLVNSALKAVLGKGIRQAGSLVTPEGFRFDYTVNRTPTAEEIVRIEETVNKAVEENYTVHKAQRPLKDAKKLGAVTLLGEKYSDPARFVLINHGGWEKACEAGDAGDRLSLELCGGTHVDATGELMTVIILKDSGLSAGIRRIEGAAGPAALAYLREASAVAESVSRKLSTNPNELESRITQLLQHEKKLKAEINSLRRQIISKSIPDAETKTVQLDKGLKLTMMKIDGADAASLRELSDKFRAENKNAVFFATSANAEKLFFVVSTTPDTARAQGKGPDANTLAKAIAQRLGGSAGGRPDFAQGGGNDPGDWEDLTREVAKLARKRL